MPSLRQQLLGDVDRPGQHHRGSEPIEAKALMRARGFRPRALPPFLGADQHGGRAIDDARGVAGVVDVVDALRPRDALDADGVEAHLAHLEGGFSPASVCMSVLGRMSRRGRGWSGRSGP
jgi:hypothetical protein